MAGLLETSPPGQRLDPCSGFHHIICDNKTRGHSTLSTLFFNMQSLDDVALHIKGEALRLSYPELLVCCAVTE